MSIRRRRRRRRRRKTIVWRESLRHAQNVYPEKGGRR
jgi:hypothetical protein